MAAYSHRSTEDLGRDYPDILDDLRESPIVGSRGGRTREIVDYSLELRNPTRCIVDRDSVSRRFMDAEIAMLLAGVYDGELLAAITPKAAELTTPLTAYGPRVRHQIPLVIAELARNPESRRAVIYVGRPTDLDSIGPDTAGEMPCTLTWQFLIRDDELHMIVNMRSWDAVWGLTYDVPCFVAVQVAVAKALLVRVGRYRHHAGSFHLYERHWKITAHSRSQELELDWVGDTWESTVAAAETFIEIYRMGVVAEVARRASLEG